MKTGPLSLRGTLLAGILVPVALAVLVNAWLL